MPWSLKLYIEAEIRGLNQFIIQLRESNPETMWDWKCVSSANRVWLVRFVLSGDTDSAVLAAELDSDRSDAVEHQRRSEEHPRLNEKLLQLCKHCFKNVFIEKSPSFLYPWIDLAAICVK